MKPPRSQSTPPACSQLAELLEARDSLPHRDPAPPPATHAPVPPSSLPPGFIRRLPRGLLREVMESTAP